MHFLWPMQQGMQDGCGYVQKSERPRMYQMRRVYEGLPDMRNLDLSFRDCAEGNEEQGQICAQIGG